MRSKPSTWCCAQLCGAACSLASLPPFPTCSAVSHASQRHGRCHPASSPMATLPAWCVRVAPLVCPQHKQGHALLCLAPQGHARPLHVVAASGLDVCSSGGSGGGGGGDALAPPTSGLLALSELGARHLQPDPAARPSFDTLSDALGAALGGLLTATDRVGSGRRCTEGHTTDCGSGTAHKLRRLLAEGQHLEGGWGGMHACIPTSHCFS